MRQRKEARTDVDLKKPMTDEMLPKTNPDDCFGNEWDMETRECRYCHDNEFCGLVFSFKLKKKVKDVTEAEGGFFDEEDFSAVDERGIIAKMNGMTVKDLVALIAIQSKSKDEFAVREFAKRLILDNGFRTREGVISKKEAQ